MERRPPLGGQGDSATQVAADRKSAATAKQARRGDKSVRHTVPGRFDSGRLLRTYDLEREDARGSYDARARVTRREPVPSQLA